MPTYRLNFRSGKQLHYSTERGVFFTEEMTPITFDLSGIDELHDWKHEPYAPGAIIKKSRKPRKVRIVMGFDCNFKCKYCSQKVTRESSAERMFKLADSFLEKFFAAIDEPPRSIEFWGGEPFVYFKTLQKIVPQLRKAYPKTTFRIITNGSMINRQIADFILKNQIVLVVSHDAKGQANRGEDPLADPEKKALLLELYHGLQHAPHGENEASFGFACVMTKNNCDPLEIGKFFRDNFHPKVSVSCSYVTAMGGIAADKEFLSVAFDKDSLVKMSRNVLRALDQIDSGNGANTLLRDARNAITKLLRCETVAQIGSRCETDSPEHLIVKLDGNVLQCQNTNAHGEYGNIAHMDKVGVDGFYMWNHRPTCRKCPIVHLCYGACPALKGNGFVDSCNVNWAYYSALFKFAVSRIFRDELVSIEGDILRPQRELVETKHGKAVSLKKVEMPF